MALTLLERQKKHNYFQVIFVPKNEGAILKVFYRANLGREREKMRTKVDDCTITV